jgi:dTDP-4-amino-4,6-dideoxygalactose transaminase
MTETPMEKIPFARPYVGLEEEEAVLRVLRSGWLTTGSETLAFEEEFGAFLKARVAGDIHCMALNSATSGLHLVLEAFGVGAGDIVLVPSMTFTACGEVVRYLGAEVVFVDTVKSGFHMDPVALEETLKMLEKKAPGRAKAVMPVHYGGLLSNMPGILDIAKRYNLKVVEDAAHSFPSYLESSGSWAGLMGDAGVFSFYATFGVLATAKSRTTKTMTTGEGGMVITRDKALSDRIKIMRSHGIDRSVWDRYTDTKASWYYEVVEPGYKYNPAIRYWTSATGACLGPAGHA